MSSTSFKTVKSTWFIIVSTGVCNKMCSAGCWVVITTGFIVVSIEVCNKVSGARFSIESSTSVITVKMFRDQDCEQRNMQKS